MIQTVEVADIEKSHSNPVAELVQIACRFESHITIQCDGKFINAKSLMGMMAFGLRKGLMVEISADGVDETQAVDTLKEFLEN